MNLKTCLSIVVCCLTLAPGFAQSATLYWQGDASNLWSVAANWNTAQNGAGSDQVPANADVLVFDTNTPGVGNFANNNDLVGLTDIEIQIVDDDANDFSISGNSIELAANGIIQTTTNGFTRITTPFTLAAPTTFTNIGNNRIVIQGDIDNAGHLLTFGGTNRINFDGVLSGAGGLTLNTSVTLSDANTYAGLTTINGGSTANIVVRGQLGSTAGGTIVNAGGRLSFDANGSTGYLAEPVTLDGGSLQAFRPPATFPGPITLASDSTLDVVASGDLTLTGQITGAGGFAKTGSDVLTLSNSSNNYAGATNVTAGTLRMGDSEVIPSSSPVDLAAGAFLDLNGFVEQATVSGQGTVTNNGSSAGSLGFFLSSTFDGVIQDGTETTNVSFGEGHTTLQTTTLTGTHTYTGTTTIANNATLILDGQIGPAGLVTVGFNTGGATLAGSGVLEADVQVDDELSPGNGSPDELTTNNLTFSGSGQYTVELQGTAAGQFDQAIVNGTATLGGATLDVTLGGGYVPMTGDSIPILTTIGGVTGEFAGLADGDTFFPNGAPMTIDYGTFDVTIRSNLGGLSFMKLRYKITDPPHANRT